MDDLKQGDRVELVHTDDDVTKLKPGDLGTFQRHGPDGGLSIAWDSGSNLRMLPDEGDVVRKVTS
jgi:hypothetical protein